MQKKNKEKVKKIFLVFYTLQCLEKKSSASYSTAAFRLASGHPGLEIKIPDYFPLYTTVMLWCAKLLQSCLTLCTPCSPPPSSVHGISQAILLEWVAMLSRGSSPPRDRTRVSCGSHQGSPGGQIPPQIAKMWLKETETSSSFLWECPYEPELEISSVCLD